MPAIERIIISRDSYGAEPRLSFSIADRHALQRAIVNRQPSSNRREMFACLLERMGHYAGQNLPQNWKEIFLSGETFSWEFLPGSTSS